MASPAIHYRITYASSSAGSGGIIPRFTSAASIPLSHAPMPSMLTIYFSARGGFRHVQHVWSNRGPHKRTGKFLLLWNIQ